MFEDEIDDRLLRRIKAYIGVNKEPSGQYLGHVDNYKGIDIIKYIPPRSDRELLLAIVGDDGTSDWVEFYGDEIENAYDYIDILTEKGKEAADDYWYNVYEEESDRSHGYGLTADESTEVRKETIKKKEDRKMNFKEYLDSFDDMVEEEVELPETVYAVSYTIDEGPNQSIMVKANSEDEAIDKFMKRYPEAFVIGASVEYNPAEMERRGKPMLEELADGVKVHDWYMETFPDDTLGMEINPELTFDDVLKALDDKKDIYVTLDVADSIIRERVFDRLAQLTGMDYDDIYTKWLATADTDPDELQAVMDKTGWSYEKEGAEKADGSLSEAAEDNNTGELTMKQVLKKIIDKFGNNRHKYRLTAEGYERYGRGRTYHKTFFAPNDWLALFSMELHERPSVEAFEDYCYPEDLQKYLDKYPTFEDLLKHASAAWYGDGDDHIISLENLTTGKVLYEDDGGFDEDEDNIYDYED